MTGMLLLGLSACSLMLGAEDHPPLKPDLVPVRAKAQPMSCGPAAASIVLAYFGKEVAESTLGSLVEPDGNTSFLGLSRLFQSLDLEPLAIRCRPEDLRELNGVAILQLRASSNVVGAKPSSHFVVAMHEDGKPLSVMDSTLPMETWGRLSPEAAVRSWTGNVLIVRRRVADPSTTVFGVIGAVFGGAGIWGGMHVARRWQRRREPVPGAD